ncbi:hypothetical protein POM88_028929 [Heracleum sosnowskyi]|uniref:Uncharacterized protein n=1 Tax=Heracleum sosnowskyi TaxID=360622 RepID=A0AAD8MGS6_9APIA|nr:hypothetical protein POM88_028929 [Heracleum sosnowskyi]
MAESYLGEESVEFCQEFVNQSCTTAGLRKDAGKLSGPLSVVTMKPVEEKERDEAHLHVLLNNPEVHPYILMHKKYLEEIHQGKKKSGHWILTEHNRLFADWFEKEVSSEMMENDEGELYNENELGDTTMENPPFCSSIPICDVSDDVDYSIRENVEGTWVKN